jgi:hypothetical protein
VKPGRIYSLVQLGFVVLYVAMGFALLLHPAFKERFGETASIGIGIVLLAYAGYRGFTLYRNFRADDE